MTTTKADDNGVDARVGAAAIGNDDISYAVPGASRRRWRLVVPVASLGLGAALGGTALALLQLR